MEGIKFEGPKRLLQDISNAFFHDTCSELCDVSLKSSDGITIDTNRTLLAIRSPVFHKLLFSDFKEGSQQTVRIELEHNVLCNVVEYLITGKVKKFEAKNEKYVNDILKLAHAADYFDCNPLFRDCLLILETIVSKCPNLVCCVAESVLLMDRTKPNMDIKDVLLNSMLFSMTCYPVDCFSVPCTVMCNDDNGNTTCGRTCTRRTTNLVPTKNNYRNVVVDVCPGGCNVQVLGFETLRELVCVDKKKKKCGIDQEYLVLVIYYWTHGKTFVFSNEHEFGTPFTYTEYEAKYAELLGGKDQRVGRKRGNDCNSSGGGSNTSSSNNSVATDRVRIKQGSMLMDYIDGGLLRPAFIKKVLEPMRLVNVGKLAEIYRAQAIGKLKCGSSRHCKSKHLVKMQEVNEEKLMDEYKNETGRPEKRSRIQKKSLLLAHTSEWPKIRDSNSRQDFVIEFEN